MKDINNETILSPFLKYDIVSVDTSGNGTKKTMGLIVGVKEVEENVYLYDVHYMKHEDGKLEKGQFNADALTLVFRQENYVTNIPLFKSSVSRDFHDFRKPTTPVQVAKIELSLKGDNKDEKK